MSVTKTLFQSAFILGFAAAVGGWSYSVNMPLTQFKYLYNCVPLITKEKTGFEEVCTNYGPTDRVLELIVRTRDEKLKKADCDFFCEQWNCQPSENGYSAQFEVYECLSRKE